MNQIANMGIMSFIEDSAKELATSMEWMRDREMRVITNMQELSDFIDVAINEKKICAVDLETTGLSSRIRDGVPVNKIVGYCLAHNIMEGVYVPVNHQEGAEYNLPEAEVLAEIRRLCKSCRVVFHNSKFDMSFLKNYGVTIDDYKDFEDTQILARLYDAGQKTIGLKALSDRLLNQPMIEFSDVTRDVSKRFDLVSPKAGYVYAVSDAICTLQLFQFFMDQEVIKEQIGIYNLEKRVVFVVMEMESNLVLLDVPYIQAMELKIKERIQEITQDIYRIAGKEFNIGSTPQLGTLLFDELGYRYPEKNRTASGQYSTDGAALEKIKEDYPIVKMILEYRVLDKVHGTYIRNLLANRDDDNCVKLGFNQTGTDTGRFSSPGGAGIKVDGYCGVNVQSLPAKSGKGLPQVLQDYPIRRFFRARPGFKLVAMDYSGEELRIATNLSGEPKWLNEFLEGSGDLHSITTRVIYNLSADATLDNKKMQKSQRGVGKSVNFLSLYGGGSRGLAVQASISEREARKMLTNFYTGLPTLKKWIEREHKRARQTKKVSTVLGRVRPLNFFYDSGDRGIMARGDRCAINTQIQGCGADIMKTAMVRVYNWIHREGLQEDIKILITMHDEIVYEIREDKLMDFVPKLNRIMALEDIFQGKLKWPIPLTLDAEYGDTWYPDNDFFKEHPELRDAGGDVSFHTSSQIVDESPKDTPQEPEPPESEPPKEPESKEPESKEPETTGDVSEVPQQAQEPPVQPQESPDTVTENPETVTAPKDSTSSGGSEEPQKDEPVPISIDQDLSQVVSDRSVVVYTLKNRHRSTLRRLNEILYFVKDEERRGSKYESDKKLLKIRDRDGNALLVEDIKFNVDVFVALMRYEGL